MKIMTFALAMFLAFSWNGRLLAGEVHEHGRATLELAIEGELLELRLEGPLDGFVGFEHAPRSEAERADLRQAIATLSAPDGLVELPVAAGCDLIDAEARHPFDGHGGGGHDDRQASPPNEGHAEMVVTQRFRCQTPARLTSLRLRLFGTFPRVGRVDAVVVGPAGQQASSLSPAQRVVRLR